MVLYKYLADQILDKSRKDEILLCQVCGSEYSANAGDYWYLTDDYNMTCNATSDCNNNDLTLVKKIEHYAEVSTDDIYKGLLNKAV